MAARRLMTVTVRPGKPEDENGVVVLLGHHPRKPLAGGCHLPGER
jgi:hypothetical protein